MSGVHTRWGGDGESACYDPQNQLLEEHGVYASIDDWNCAAAILPGLHGGRLSGFFCRHDHSFSVLLVQLAKAVQYLSYQVSRCCDTLASAPPPWPVYPSSLSSPSPSLVLPSLLPQFRKRLLILATSTRQPVGATQFVARCFLVSGHNLWSLTVSQSRSIHRHCRHKVSHPFSRPAPAWSEPDCHGQR